MLIGVAALVAVVVLAVRSFRRRERLDARGAVL
jgi:hypothetical protein